MRVAGFTSTGSKRPEALFGSSAVGVPARLARSEGCHVTDDRGRTFLDFVMALGAVGLGYGHPAVTAAVAEAAARGAVGPLGPVLEEEVAALLARLLPGVDQVRFLKTGAEAAAAAVRLARVATGRDFVLGCGYHGWLDWCSRGRGVPEPVSRLYGEIPFNDVERSAALIRAAGPGLACVMIEPVIDAPPDPDWLEAVRSETHRAGAVLVFDEVKTAFRVALGGAAARYGVVPDLVVIGKALANGFPLAAVGGRADLMAKVAETWISSTLATEFVSLAAARATLGIIESEDVPGHLGRVGALLYAGLERLQGRHAALVESVSGIPEMCYLRFREPGASERMAVLAAERGLLFKRTAYNFVSLAHGPAEVESALATLDGVLGSLT
ncbi:MAG: aminotransferase class III-fold pyridoxal phosphate-dependent enzyme [Gemmatimonadota bacterium]